MSTCHHCGEPLDKPHESDCVMCHVEDEISALQLRLRLHGGYCDVCWTSSWTPIPPEEEADCRLVHPHEGDHARCNYCWLHDQFANQAILWASGVCSRHQIPVPTCGICNSKLFWDEWVVEYDENSIAWIVSRTHPDVRRALAHGRSISQAIANP